MDESFPDSQEFLNDFSAAVDPDYQFRGHPTLSTSTSTHSRNPDSTFSTVSPVTGGTSAAQTPSSIDNGFTNINGWDEWKDWIDMDEAQNPAAEPLTLFPQLDPQLYGPFPFGSSDTPETDGLSEPPLFSTLSTRDLGGFPFAATEFLMTPSENGSAGFAQLQTIPEAPQPTAQTPSSFGHSSSPESEPPASRAKNVALPSKKRKLDPFDEEGSPQPPLPQRGLAHNTVEKRYRNRLKDMIATLRDHIPSLQNLDKNGGERGAAGQSVTKGIVLSKAKDYIIELQACNKRLTEENSTLKKQVMVLGKLNVQLTVKTADSRRSTGGAVSKVMVGGLAGMLATQGFNTPEQSNDMPSGRGLFALPADLLAYITRSFHSHHLSLLTNSAHMEAGLSVLRGVLLVSAVVYIFLPWVFDALAPKPPPPKVTEVREAQTEAAPSSLANIQEVRRDAFLTATQTIWVPSRRLELCAAVLRQVLNLALHSWNMDVIFSRHRGVTDEDAAEGSARAWDTVVDAQLTGGDDNATFGRTLLTFLGAGSLPETPYRLMLRAMHARVLSELAEEWWSKPLKGLLAGSSRSLWERARALRKASAESSKSDGDQPLPSYLAEMLDHDADDVFVDEVVQRASELAAVGPPCDPKNAASPEDWVDAIVRDNAVVSPLDLLAAWRSSALLCNALALFPAVESADEIKPDLDAALRLAPPGSAGWARTLVARALILPEKDQRRNISVAFQALLASSLSQPFVSADSEQAPSKPRGLPAIPRDLALALRCAIAIDRLDGQEGDRAVQALAVQVEALPDARDGLLGTLEVVALYQFLRVLFGEKELRGGYRGLCEKVGGLLRISMRGDGEGDVLGLDETAVENVSGLCVDVFEWLVGIREDRDDG